MSEQELSVVVTNIEKGKLDFHWDNLNQKFEQVLKSKINVLGSNNTAYTPDVLPQDKLSKAWGWVHGNCGLVVQALWESGRQDGFIIAEYEKVNDETYKRFGDWIRPLFGTATDQLIMVKKEQDDLLTEQNVQIRLEQTA